MARPPRLQGFEYRGGYRYFLTICAYQRRLVFQDASAIDLVLEQIRFTAAEQSFENIAYCFMWDHLHLLIAGVSEDSDLEKFAKLMKQRSAWRFAQRGDGRLWQVGYYDRIVRCEEATGDVIRYIIENPIRAAIAKSPDAYPYWGSEKYSREELLDFIQGAAEWSPKRRA